MVVIASTLVCLSSWATFRAGSQSKSAAHDSNKKAGVSQEASGSGIANAKKMPKGSGTVSASVATATTPTHFLAAVEQIGVNTGQVDLFNVTLGSGSGSADTIAAASPATVPVTNSTNESKPDIDNPLSTLFDPGGDLLIGNGNDGGHNHGTMACVPASAITTNVNASTTVSANVTSPVAMAFDKRDGSVAIADNPAGVAGQVKMSEYLLGSQYTAAPGTGPGTRNLVADGLGNNFVVNLPTLTTGTYASALTDGGEVDPAHGGPKTSKIAIYSPTGVETDILGSSTTPVAFAIDNPAGLAWDAANNQLVIGNNSIWHTNVSFYTVSPVSQVKVLNTGRRNFLTAASPDGYVAVAMNSSVGSGAMLIQVFDNTASRNPVGGPIPYNSTSDAGSCGNYIYGDGPGGAVQAMTWLSNTKLLVAVSSINAGTQTALNGLYIYDISSLVAPTGFNDETCAAYAPAPKQTGFVHLNKKPFGFAFTTPTIFADPSADPVAHTCSGKTSCYPTITSAIAATAPGGIVNVLGGTFNENVTVNNNVIINLDGNTTINDLTITAGATLNGGGGFCAQANAATLTVKGNWSNGGTFNAGGGTVIFGGTTAQSIGGSNVTTFNDLTINSTSTVTPTINTSVAGNLAVTTGTFDLLGFTANRTSSGGTLTVSNGATLKVGGANSLPTNYTTYTLGTTSTVEYEGASTQTITAVNYGHLTSSSTGARTLASSGTIGIAGTFTTGANTYTTSGSTVNFNGAGSQNIPALNYNNLTSSNTGARTLASSGVVGIAGTFTTGANAYTVTGSTVSFNGSAGAQSIPGFTFNNLTLANSSGATLGGAVGVGGTLTLTSGTLGVASQTLTLNNATSVGAGGLSSNTNGTVNYNQGADGQTVLAANYGNLTFSNFNKTLPGSTTGIAGAFTPGNATGHTITGNTIDFNGSSAQNIPAFTYNNLTSSSTGARTLAGSGIIKIAGAFTPGTNAYTITGSTVECNGAGAQGIPTFTYNNLSITGARGGAVVTLAGSGIIKIAGTFNPSATAVSYTTTGSTIEYNGSGSAQALPSTFTTYNNLTLSNAAGVNGFNSPTLNLTGNWTNNGSTFNAGAGTTNFNGTATQSIGGTSATTFNHLTNANTAGISLGTNETVGGILALTSSDITTGANTLTMPATGSSTGPFDVIGNVKRTGFVSGGSPLSFGHPDNQITINTGGVPSDITLNLAKSAPSSPAFPTAVKRTYTITPNGGSITAATLRLRYLDPTELNSNTEVGLGLFRSNGTAWVRLGETAADTNNNWVELSGITQFSASAPWTLSSAKNNSTTTINTVAPEPSIPGQSVTINYTVAGSPAGGPAPTADGTTNFVTVSDGTSSCQGALTNGAGSSATGSCQITFNSSGTKNLTATYSGDANYNASPASSDATQHTVLTPPNIAVNDAKVAEPATGTTQMLFTVSLDHAYPGGTTVNYATADGTATGGNCGDASVDYQAIASTPLVFGSTETVKTIPVTICSDNADNTEANETLLLNLSGATVGTISRAQATGTITHGNPPGTFIISELRTSGPAGSADEFIELYNNTDSQLTVTASDTSAGYGVFKMGTDCSASPVLVATILNNTVIPARDHYLLKGAQYSLSNYGGAGAAAADQTMTSDIEADANVAVFSTADVTHVSSVTRLDAVGFGTNTGGNVCDLLREGATLPALSGSALEYSYFRNLAATGQPADTNDNSADFLFADTQATAIAGEQRLGAPGPENRASPINRGATIKPSLLDPLQSSSAPPNRERDLTVNVCNGGTAPSNCTLGTLTIRRTFTNNTGGSVSKLRFRVVDITTAPQAAGNGTADLRLLSSLAATVNGKSILQMTVDAPPTQSRGGGYNSTIVATLPGGSLAPSNSVSVQFTLGVQQTGNFRFFIIVEALP
jgi:hypothetical protein